MWKEKHKELETSKKHQITVEIDKLGNLKTLKQTKDKLRNMKDAYKKCKGNNKKTVHSPEFWQIYEDLDEILGIRDVVNFPFAKEISSGDNVTNEAGDNSATEGMPCSILSNKILWRGQSFAKHL